jgi:hypothetical protein
MLASQTTSKLNTLKAIMEAAKHVYTEENMRPFIDDLYPKRLARISQLASYMGHVINDVTEDDVSVLDEAERVVSALSTMIVAMYKKDRDVPIPGAVIDRAIKRRQN